MNHHEFERQCWAEPHRQDTEFLVARDATEANQAIYQAAQRFEHNLKDALAVAIPAELKPGILARAQRPDAVASKDRADTPKAKVAVLSGRAKTPRAGLSPAWRWAMAASVMLSLAVGGILGHQWRPAATAVNNLDVVLMEHMMHEYAAMDNVQAVSRKQINDVMLPFGFKAADGIGDVVHAAICTIKHRPGIHLILRVQNQPVTVMFINKAQIGAPRTLDYQGFSGVVRPHERGAWAVIAPDDALAGQVIQQLDSVIVRAL